MGQFRDLLEAKTTKLDDLAELGKLTDKKPVKVEYFDEDSGEMVDGDLRTYTVMEGGGKSTTEHTKWGVFKKGTDEVLIIKNKKLFNFKAKHEAANALSMSNKFAKAIYDRKK